MKKRNFVVSVCVILALIIVVSAWDMINPEEEWNPPAQGKYAETIVVAADKDYPPFSFVDKNGVMAGHDAALIYALGEEMKVNIDLRFVEWDSAFAGLQSGEYDLLMGVTNTPKRRASLCLSMPTVSATYVAFGKEWDAFSLAGLGKKRFSTISGDSVNNVLLALYGLSALNCATYTECFRMLATGKCDYVIAPYSTGWHLIRSLKLRGLGVVSPVFYNSIYCVAAAAGREALIADVNGALVRLSESGRLAALSDRWLNLYSNFSIYDFIFENLSDIFVLALVVILILFVLLYMHKRASYRKLYIATERARILEETETSPIVEYDPLADRINYTFKDAEGVTQRIAQDKYLAERQDEKVIAPEYLEECRRFLRRKTSLRGGEHLEFRGRMLSDDWRWYRLVAYPVKDEEGRLLRLFARLEDITDVMEKREEAFRLASLDMLTKLMNREAFFNAVRERLAASPKAPCAFIMIDIDDFKNINDNYGHSTGDEALRAVAEKMGRALAADDLLGRFGGDEFMAFMQCDSRDIVRKRLEQMQELLSQSVKQDEFSLTCSCGVVFTKGGILTAEEMMEFADKALYKAKNSGKNRILFSGLDEDEA